MKQGRLVRRRRAGTFVVLIGLLSGLFGVVGPLADAAPVPPGVVGNFEIDGDQTSPAGGTIDWGDVDPTVLIDSISPDNGLQGSSKEDEPEEFACQAKSPTVTPGKDNLVRAYINTRIVSADSAFLDLGFVRSDGGTQGDSHVNFEFNQNPITNMCPYTGRADGDLLITFDFPGNATDPAEVQTFAWDADAPDGSDAPGRWVSFEFTGSAAAEDNIAAITDQVVGGSIAARAFGEATIDLIGLAEAVGAADDGCSSFGFASIRSRSSGESFSSALQDILGGPIDVTTCGKVIVHKTDDAGNPLAGATFGLWPEGVAVPAVGAGGTRPSTGSIATCTSIADGSCTFDEVDPGDFKVAEISPPAGYDIDPDVIDVTVGFRQTVDVAAPFVDPRDVGSVTITKRIWDDKNTNGIVDAGEIVDLKVAAGVVYNDLDHNGVKSADEPTVDLTGITFKLLSSGVQASTWPPPGSPAQCTIPAGSLSCTIGPVVLGSYTITEAIDPAKPLPDGVSKGPDVAVTLTQDDVTVSATFTNPVSPLNIDLQKSGPATANVGDTYTYQFDVSTTGPRLHDVTVEELLPNRCNAGALTGPNKSVAVDPQNDADAFLEVGETWRWTCQHLVTPADGASIHNEAIASGTDDLGREVSDEDPHDVIVLRPDLAVVKLAADGVDADDDPSDDETIDAPGTASYTITVTNLGTGIARNATLTDDLPAGSWTVTLASPDGNDICPVGGNPVSGDFTCTFGDLAAGASKTVTVSRPVTLANDCAVTLENNAGVTTTYQQVDIDSNAGNNGPAAASINVRCPDVGVLKTASNTPISAGQRAAWTITLTNNGAGVANDVFLVDTVPASLTSLQLGGANAASCSLVDHALSCDFGDLPGNDGAPGGPDTRVITISGLTDFADCGTIPNTARVAASAQGGAYVDSNTSNNSSTASVDVECPNVWVDKTGPASVNATDTITWTVTFGNDGEGSAFGVILTDTLPAGLTGYVLGGPDAALCVLGGGFVTCTFEEMAPGDEFEVTITGTTDPADCPEVTNPVAIEADNDDPEDDGDNSAESTTDVLCPDVDLEKTEVNRFVSAGDGVAFDITVTNTGPGVAYDVVVTDTLEAIPGYTWAIDPAVPGCALEGLELSCDLGDLSPDGDPVTIHLVATWDGEPFEASPCGDVPNLGTVTLGNGSEEDLSNNDAEVTVLCPGVTLSKAPDSAIIELGGTVGFTITVTNSGPGIARDLQIRDLLPTGFDWSLSGDNIEFIRENCAIVEGEIECSLGDTPGPAQQSDPPTQFSIHLTAPTAVDDFAQCGTLTNVASASIGNGDDPDDAEADVNVLCPLEIELVKDGPDVAQRGDEITYTFAVTNTGGEDLHDVVLADPICDEGTQVWLTQGDGDAILEKDSAETWTAECTRVIRDSDPDPLPNTATVSGEDDFSRTTDDTDDHLVDILHPEVIAELTAECADNVPLLHYSLTTVDVSQEEIDEGATITFVNPDGEDVVYEGLPLSGTVLWPGAVLDDDGEPIDWPGWTLTEEGTWVEGDEFDWTRPTVDILVQINPEVAAPAAYPAANEACNPPVEVDPRSLPQTGSDTQRLLTLAGVLLLVGGAMLVTGSPTAVRARRRRH